MIPDPKSRTHEGPHLRNINGSTFQVSPDPVSIPMFTIFYQEPVDQRDLVASCDVAAIPDIAGPGWYWEDAEEKPAGPFRTSALAYVDATKRNYP